MSKETIFDFSKFVEEQERPEAYIKIKDKKFKILYSSYTTLRLIELQRRDDLSEDELAKEILSIGLGIEAAEWILNANLEGKINEATMMSIFGTILFILLDLKTPEEINQMNNVKK